MLFGFDFLENLSKCADLDFAQEKEGAVNRKEISWSRVQPEPVLLRSGTKLMPDSKNELNPTRLTSAGLRFPLYIDRDFIRAARAIAS